MPDKIMSRLPSQQANAMTAEVRELVEAVQEMMPLCRMVGDTCDYCGQRIGHDHWCHYYRTASALAAVEKADG